MPNKKRLSRRRIYIITSAVLLMFAAACFIWWQTRQPSSAEDSSAQTSKSVVDLSPATEADKQDSNSHKTPDANPQPETSNPNNKLVVTPVVVDANQYAQQIEVRSYVTGIIENGGICKFTFSQGSTSFQRQNTAIADATTTKCPNLTVDPSAFPTMGTWSVTVGYESVKASGVSNPAEFEVK